MYKQRMQEDGRRYLSRCEKSIGKVAELGVPFIFDGAVSNIILCVLQSHMSNFHSLMSLLQNILVHSNSQVVLETLITVPENIQFSVFITTSNRDKAKGSGVQDFQEAIGEKNNIKCTFIHDSEIGYMMESIDLVLVGAEAVVKNGGILNKVRLVMHQHSCTMNKSLMVLGFDVGGHTQSCHLCQGNQQATFRPG